MQNTLLHKFSMSNVEDPYLYAAFPISEWQQTDHGKWVMEHVQDQPTFYCEPDPATLGYRVAIWGKLHDQDVTYLKLKWGR